MEFSRQALTEGAGVYIDVGYAALGQTQDSSREGAHVSARAESGVRIAGRAESVSGSGEWGSGTWGQRPSVFVKDLTARIPGNVCRCDRA